MRWLDLGRVEKMAGEELSLPVISCKKNRGNGSGVFDRELRTKEKRKEEGWLTKGCEFEAAAEGVTKEVHLGFPFDSTIVRGKSAKQGHRKV